MPNELSTNQNYLTFDVGNQLFCCHQSTIDKYPSSRIAQEARRFIANGGEGHIFFDRNGDYFAQILNFMRNPGAMDLNNLCIDDMQEFLKEAQYYKISQLEEMCKSYIDFCLQPRLLPKTGSSFNCHQFEFFTSCSDLLKHLGRQEKVVYLFNLERAIKFNGKNLNNILCHIDENLLDVYCFQGSFPGLAASVATLLYHPARDLVLTYTIDTSRETQYLILYFVQKLIRQGRQTVEIADLLEQYVNAFTQDKTTDTTLQPLRP